MSWSPTTREHEVATTGTGDDLDASTGYRSLTTSSIRLLPTTARPDQPCSYGLAGTAGHYAVWTRCGQLREIPAPPLRVAVDRAARIGDYQLTDASLPLLNVCPTCRNPRPASPATATTRARLAVR